MRVTPQAFDMPSKVELVEGANVNKVGIFAGDLIGVLIFFHWLVTTGPLADPSNGLFVRSFQNIFGRETRANDHEHELFAAVKAVLPFSEPGDTTVAVPVLA